MYNDRGQWAVHLTLQVTNCIKLSFYGNQRPGHHEKWKCLQMSDRRAEDDINKPIVKKLLSARKVLLIEDTVTRHRRLQTFIS